jgi:hypothetical protein
LSAVGPGTLRVPPRPAAGVRLAHGGLRELLGRLRSGKASAADLAASAKGVRVEILHALSGNTLASLLVGLGATNLRPIDEATAEAVVPVSALEALEASNGVHFVRPPLVVNGPPDRARAFDFAGLEAAIQAGSITGQHVAKTNASNWHASGRLGNGVKVGIIDGFSSTHWNQAITSGDLPNPAGVFCVEEGVACDIWAPARADTHGVGVAEIINDMAPGAQLYIAYASPTAADLQAAVNYFASQGVRVISRSQAAWYDGPGNGTGPIAGVIENAVSRGMVWFNSAGNSAGTAADPGAYWRGAWADPNGDTWLEFRPGDLSFGFYCGFALGVRWSDWGLLRTDYDIYVYDDPNLTILQAKGENDQPGGAPPIEHFMNPMDPTKRANTCDAGNDVDFMAIKLFNANGGTAGDTLEFMVNNSREFEYLQNEHSATQPASDTASAGGLSVGAIEPWNGTTIAPYSSWGPSNDGRIKPDLSAGTCVSTTVDTCFNGTSGATPVVAGAAALYIGANPTASPAQVKAFILSSVVERGAAGADNVYGMGELLLPSLAAPVAPDRAAPSTPSGLRRSAVTDTSISVAWGASVDDRGVAGYGLYLNGAGAGATGATSHTFSGLACGRTYSIQVDAFDGAGNRSGRATVSVPTPRCVVVVRMALSGPRARFQRERTFQVGWAAVRSGARYDVQQRSAAFRRAYGSWRSWKSNTPLTSASFTGGPGTSYCFRVRANERSGFRSAWTAPRCTSVPVSVLNPTMRGRGGWRYFRAPGRFLNAFGLSVRRGASLGLNGVRATRLALVATKCPRCGTANVYWNKRLLASVRLTSSSLLYKQIIEVGSFTTQQRGSVRIVVTSRGKPVAIEGLGIWS